MLDWDLFDASIDAVSEILPGGPKSVMAKKIYYRAVQNLPAQRFKQVMNAAVMTLEFFPKPKWILEEAINFAKIEAASSKVLSLPDGKDRELKSLTPEQCRENQMKLRKMMREVGNG